ncbi:hypothetical protein IIB34_06390 [PVC group bacterium]|nr:hypothetical protein [PVC group bacterium]
MSQSIENKVISRIYGNKRGYVFTQIHFLDLGTRSAVSKALERLVGRRTIRRLARGLYDYPKKHPELGNLPANYEQIGKALAVKDNLRIQPSGAYAANLLGLTEQVSAKIVFLTDGANRTVNIGNQKIILKKTTPKNMAAAGRISGLIIQALRYLGKDQVDTQIVEKLDRRLSSEDKQQLIKDIRYAPAWISEIFRKLGKKENT